MPLTQLSIDQRQQRKELMRTMTQFEWRVYCADHRPVQRRATPDDVAEFKQLESAAEEATILVAKARRVRDKCHDLVNAKSPGGMPGGGDTKTPRRLKREMDAADEALLLATREDNNAYENCVSLLSIVSGLDWTGAPAPQKKKKGKKTVRFAID